MHYFYTRKYKSSPHYGLCFASTSITAEPHYIMLYTLLHGTSLQNLTTLCFILCFMKRHCRASLHYGSYRVSTYITAKTSLHYGLWCSCFVDVMVLKDLINHASGKQPKRSKLQREYNLFRVDHICVNNSLRNNCFSSTHYRLNKAGYYSSGISCTDGKVWWPKESMSHGSGVNMAGTRVIIKVSGHQYRWLLAWWLWPGNRTFLEVSSMVVTWWIVALCAVYIISSYFMISISPFRFVLL